MPSTKASPTANPRDQLPEQESTTAHARGRKTQVALRGRVAYRRYGVNRSHLKHQILSLHKLGMPGPAIARRLVTPEAYVRSVIRRHAHGTAKAHPYKNSPQANPKIARLPDGPSRRPNSKQASETNADVLPRVVQNAAAQLAKALEDASPSELLSTASTLMAWNATNEDEQYDFLGPAPTKQEFADALVANMGKQFAARKAVEAESLSRDDVASALGTSTTAVGDWLDSGKLSGFRVGRRWMIPAWQLDADTTDGLISGLRELINVFPGGAVPLTRWIHKPSADLADLTPYDALKEGKVAEVAASARALTS